MDDPYQQCAHYKGSHFLNDLCLCWSSSPLANTQSFSPIWGKSMKVQIWKYKYPYFWNSYFHDICTLRPSISTCGSHLFLNMLFFSPTCVFLFIKWFLKIWVGYYRENSSHLYPPTSCFLVFFPISPLTFLCSFYVFYLSGSGSSSWLFSLHFCV